MTRIIHKVLASSEVVWDKRIMDQAGVKQTILHGAAEAREAAVSLLEQLSDVVTIKQVESIQLRLSIAASGMTKVRTWMVENMRAE